MAGWIVLSLEGVLEAGSCNTGNVALTRSHQGCLKDTGQHPPGRLKPRFAHGHVWTKSAVTMDGEEEQALPSGPEPWASFQRQGLCPAASHTGTSVLQPSRGGSAWGLVKST